MDFVVLVLALALAMGSTQAQDTGGSDVEPDADALLRQMCDYISNVSHFSFEVIDTIDEARMSQRDISDGAV